MKTLILSVGDEVTSGLIMNSNAAFIAKAIEEAGLTPDRVVAIRDDVKAMVAEIRWAVKKYNVIIITGGLGPTHDDLTKHALVKAFNAPLVRDPKTLADVKKFFAKINIPMPQVNESQADAPKGFEILPNRLGTAPGLYYHDATTMLFALPGAPHEMRAVMEQEVLPILIANTPDIAIARAVLRTVGGGESAIAPFVYRTGVLEDPDVEIAFLPHLFQVDVRITVRGKKKINANEKLKQVRKIVKKAIAPWYFGKDKETLEEVLGRLLKKKGLTLASAESCTGGLFASKITSVAGASDYFLEGAVTYSNEAKTNRLKVSEETLERYGAVSAEVAAEMAKGISQTSGADIGISATGVAGPGGGAKNKPVGLVYIGLSINGEISVSEERYRHDRIFNQRRTVARMFVLLIKTVKAR